ncbi:ATP-binding protein [Streptomyces sp. WAC07061]|uniref:ATP-binding protein n=1 Tax=Streptomyces sp. WAC07061 TaxID=2487410 RepID=UPI000F7A6AAF|nr:ATP-binding protein [Streptomyces sp. WAC07061]RSS48705.1 ATP-binding protein [Streptomyces sp. WAC07061]
MNPSPPSDTPLDAERPREDAGADRPAVAQVSAATARDRVRELLLLAGVGLDGVVAADALLVTSELVTNAIRHGDGVVAFRADLEDGFLRLSVTDASSRLPAARTGTAEHPGGYGWPLIQRLAEHVACSARPGGKNITATLRLG